MSVLRFDTPLSPAARAALLAAIGEQAGRITLIAEARSSAITPARIVGRVSEVMMVSIEDMEGGSNQAWIRRARAAAAWCMRALLDADFEPIAECLGITSSGGGKGLVVFAERLRARDAGYRELTDRLVDGFIAWRPDPVEVGA